MAVSFLCDYCRAVIDVSSDDAMIVNVHRRVPEDEWADDWFVDSAKNTFRFCGQPHLAAFMERAPLPAPVGGADEDGGWGWRDTVGCVVVLVVLAALVLGAIYGFVELVGTLR